MNVTTLLYSLLPSLYSTCLSKYLNAQGVQWIIVLSSALAAVVNIVCNILNFEYHYGYSGAALSTVIANWILFLSISILIYTRHRYLKRKHLNTRQSHQFLPLNDTHIERIELGNLLSPSASAANNDSNDTHVKAIEDIDTHTWPAWRTSDVLSGWYEWLSLGIPPSCPSLLIEWGSFEIVAFLASQLGTVSLATHSILQQSCALFCMIPMSIGGAAATLVGNRLGSGEVNELKAFIRLSQSIVQ
jgi:Na+-driven multidrug efflux pump